MRRDPRVSPRYAPDLTGLPAAIVITCEDGSERAVVRWRYDSGEGHVRGVDIVRVRDGRLAESLAYVKG